jgi:hypothetical protein
MSQAAIGPVPAPVVVESKREEALELGFAQSVHALRVTMRATPAGWALVAWLTWGLVPLSDVLLWIAFFGAFWLLNVRILRGIERAGSSIQLHRWHLMAVALMDGICWGLLVLLLMTHDRYLDSWLTVVLCGIASVNLPTYITYLPAFRVLVASMWITAALSALHHAQACGLRPSSWQACCCTSASCSTRRDRSPAASSMALRLQLEKRRWPRRSRRSGTWNFRLSPMP